MNQPKTITRFVRADTPRLFITATYSRHDGGWYCEVTDREGYELHVTDVAATRGSALLLAGDWVRRHRKGAMLIEI
jgi:hypothetical protein